MPVKAAGLALKLIAKLKFSDELKFTFKCLLLLYVDNVSNKERVLNGICKKWQRTQPDLREKAIVFANR